MSGIRGFLLSTSRSRTSYSMICGNPAHSARVEFEKVFTNPADHSEVKRERRGARYKTARQRTRRRRNAKVVLHPTDLSGLPQKVDSSPLALLQVDGGETSPG